MKPTTLYWSLIEHINKVHQKTYIQARLNAWGKDNIKCECANTLVTKPTYHIFFDCLNEQIQFQRSTLWIMLELFAPEDIKTSTKTTQVLWLLGKPYNNEDQKVIPTNILVKTAELIYNAANLFFKQD